MPFTKDDAKKHNKDLTDEQAERWARIANGRYGRCMLRKDSTDEQCAEEAIKIANTFFMKGGFGGEKMDAKVDASQPGVVNFLAVSGSGKSEQGIVLQLEAARMPGSGKLSLTGNIGWDMNQSAQAALSYVKSKSRALDIFADFAREDVHIHAPVMKYTKDGPSAGAAIAVALISLFTGRPVRPGFAVTGEVSLTGGIINVGGVKAKLTAAFDAGLTDVAIPAENLDDVETLSEDVRRGLNIHLADSIDDVLPLAFGSVGAAMFLAIKKEEKDMSDFLKKCVAALGLKGDPTEENVIEAVTKSRKKADELYKALNLSAETTVDDMVSAVKTLEAKAADKKGFVPEQHYAAQSKKVEALETEIATLKAEGRERDFEALIDKNRAKVSPAMMDWAKDYYTKDPEGFKKYITSAPDVIPMGEVKLGEGEKRDRTLDGKNVDPKVRARHQRALKLVEEGKAKTYEDGLLMAVEGEK